MSKELALWLERCPLVAILRGVRPDEVQQVGQTLVEAGFAIIEVPLNSPAAYDSIGVLARLYDNYVLVGAGTVLKPADIPKVKEAGGKLIVMPHADTATIKAAKGAGLLCIPGVATPTEAYSALGAGADALKLFPADVMPPAIVKAWR